MRTSPVHYIAPSAISITPNANGSQRDLTVYVARGTKIRVRCPRAGIGTDEDGNYQEWILDGRNRRLSDTEGTREYTIYARLSKADHNNGYLVFAPKTDGGKDKYQYLTLDANAIRGITTIAGATTSNSDWYVRIGEVSAADNGTRTVLLDTGILGTDQYNNDWTQSPDDLPLRIELGCTINDEDAGPNPYVYWGQFVVLSATLVEGWTGTDIQRFDHWEIKRNSGDKYSDELWWNDSSFATTGTITLSHARGVGDDFNGAVATTFTIIAMGHSDEDGEYVPLKTAIITIFAETVEKYELVLSSEIAAFSPQSQGYRPDNIEVGIRATNQRGEVFDITNGQLNNAGLSVVFAPVESESWAPLAFSGASSAVATANIDTATVFAAQQSINIRLLRTIEPDSDDSEAQPTIAILDKKGIAFLRDGEDSKVREWIFCRSASAVTFGTERNPLPADIIGGEVNPSGAAGNDDENSNQDGWVPFGWTDEAQGTDAKLSYEYCSHRDYVRSSNDDNSSEEEATGGHWGSFSAPTIWSHYGHDAATYIIRATTGSITIASNATSAVLNTTLSFYRRENNTESAYSCYTCAFLKSGNTYTRITNTSSYPVYSSKRDSAALTYECTAAHDSIVVCIYATPSTSHNEYLAELELPIRKNGDTGGRGQSVYSLQTSVAAIKFTKNFAGVPTPNPSSFSISLQYEGLSIALPDGYGVYRRYPQGIWSSDSLGTKASNTIFSNGNYTAVEFALCSGNPNSQGSIIVSRVTVTAAWEYQRILLPAGIWENKEYTRSSTATPLVYHMGSYYYLVSDTSYVGGVYVEPGTNNNVWELADQFEVVLAKMLMADYGKIASAVFYGDHMFSQYLANETNMFSGSFTRAEEAYIIVPGQSSLSVVVGTQYKIRVTCRSNTSYTNGFFANVFYLSSEYDDTDANWSKYALAGKEKTSTNNGTSGIYNISFTSEYTGYARIYVYGYGTITKITSSISSGYDKVSPMFVNTDKVPLLVTWNNSTVSTSFTNIVYTPVPLVAGRTYALTFNAYIEGGGGYVGVYYNGSIRHSLYIDNTSEAGKTLVLTASDTTEAYIMFRTANASYRIHVNSVYIRCTNAFVPKVDVNWLTGYAHFSGDNVRFNPDGSGWLAGKNVTWEADGSGTLAAGNISWNAEGDASFRGTVHATSGEFEGTVRAHAFSSNTKMIGYTELYGEEDYIVDMENNPYVLFTAKGTYAVVTLPDPQLYEGLELQFFHIPGSRMSIGRIRFASVIYSIEEEEDGYIVEKHWTDAVASRGILVKVQALGGVWYLTSGKLEHATY